MGCTLCNVEFVIQIPERIVVSHIQEKTSVPIFRGVLVGPPSLVFISAPIICVIHSFSTSYCSVEDIVHVQFVAFLQ